MAPSCGAAVLASLVAFALLPGCGVHVMASRAASGDDDPRWGGTIGGMTHVPRITHGVVGARLGTVIHGGVRPKHVIVNGGVDFHVGERFAVIPSIELGAGSPMTREWGSPGAYGGFSLAPRLRLWGTGEEPSAYNVFTTAGDLVVIPRIGAWMPPEGHGSELVRELALDLGIRITLGTDLFTPSRGKVREPTPEDP